MYGQSATAVLDARKPAPTSTMRNVDRRSVNHLTAVSTTQQKAPGETLFAEGDEADSIYEIVQGMVRLYKLMPDGRRLVTGFLSAGHLLGLAPEGTCVYTAEAITEVTVCRYKRAAFDRLLDEVPGFAKRVLTMTSQELLAAQDRMLLLGRKSAAEKVASFLLMMADQQAADETVDIPMTRHDIADYLGLTIETVSRTFSKLKADGLINLWTAVRIEIRDRDQLEELAAGDGADVF